VQELYNLTEERVKTYKESVAPLAKGFERDKAGKGQKTLLI